MSESDFISEVKGTGYATIPIKLSRELLDRTVKAFRRFDTETSLEDKKSTDYRFH